MLLDTKQFYDELDGYFVRHDNGATERFLLDTLDGIENSMLVSSDCSGCACDDDSCEEGPSGEETKWLAERSEGIIMVLNELACFYRGFSRWDDSMRAFARVKSELELCGLEESDSYALVLINSAGTLRLLGRYEEALKSFEKAKEILDKNAQNGAYNYASLFNNTGLVYLDIEDYAKAAECFETALRYLPDTEENKAEIATNLSNLANVYFSMGNLTAANEKLDTSISIFKGLDGGVNPHYAGALNTKAYFLFGAGEFAKAAEKFKEAAELTRLIFGESKEYAVACRNCAFAYMKQGDSEKAEYYRRLAEKQS